ncbi:MAG: amidohydrolase family protein [Erythrobacter sp.]
MSRFSALAAAAVLAGSPPSALAAAQADLVIRNVTVIDPEQAARTGAQDVVIDDGRIVAVIETGTAPEAEQVIEADGKFLIPGLMDMHSHSNYRPLHDATLKLMIAHGITGIREMGSDCPQPGGFYLCLDEMQASQARLEAGEKPGPRIVELSTMKIDSNRPEDATGEQVLYSPMTVGDGRATAAGLAARGAGLLKVGEEFVPGAFRGLAQAANEKGIRFGGHVPMMFSVADVATMGMTSIEHGRDLPLDCSTFGGEFRAQVMAKLSGEEVPWPDRDAIPANVRDTFDEEACRSQIAVLVENGTYYVPTHATRELDFRAGEPEYRADPDLAYIIDMQQAEWGRDLDRTAAASPEEIADLRDFFALVLKTTGMAHDAGVKIMAGTDANDTMIVPGASLHDELGFLVRAGLTPMEALQAATSVPADYLGRTRDFGGISTGKIADLVLLDDDPTLDIANTRKIAAVIQGGVVRDRTALDALLAGVREWVAMTNERMAPPR